MAQDLIDEIKKFQGLLPPYLFAGEPEHNPQMLLIGCIDARLNPASDIGIPYGSALIKRNIAALVPPHDMDGTKGVGAALEFAIDKKAVKHVVVMGHTHCGGIAACLDEVDDVEIETYLAPLNELRDKIKEQGGSTEEQARSMEQEAVRLSLENLMTYPTIQDAVEGGRIELHGWVIDTCTRRLMVLDRKTGEFKAMINKPLPKPLIKPENGNEKAG